MQTDFLFEWALIGSFGTLPFVWMPVQEGALAIYSSPEILS